MSMVRFKSLKNLFSLFVLILICGCANQSADNSKANPTEFLIKDEWYRGDVNFQFWEADDRLQTHVFFDADPLWTEKLGLINYIPITLKGSNVLYDLDLHSGKIFKSADLCLQDDVWGTFSPRVQSPSFTMGVVPRSTHITEVKAVGKADEKIEEYKPVRIAVFHHPNDKNIKRDINLKEFSRAKILGSFYLEECLTYPCRNRDSWKKELVLVGVNIKNQSKKEIEDSDYNSFENLRDTREWKEAKVFFQSQLGVHRMGKTEIYPRFKVTHESGIEETRKRFLAEVRLRNYDEVMGLRNKCRALYDSTWSEILKIKKSNYPREELKNFTVKTFKAGNKEEYNQCLTYVRAANINVDPKRFWFFQYLRAAIVLEQSGFYYNCSQATWYPNPKNADSKYLYSTEKELSRCRSREAELIYEKAIIGMELMENQVGTSYKFIEYDTQSGGSHQKLYSWIPNGTKRLDCASKRKITLEDTFPEDVNWEEFPDGKQEGIR